MDKCSRLQFRLRSPIPAIIFNFAASAERYQFTGSYYRHYRSRQCRQQSCKSGTGIGDARFTERPSREDKEGKQGFSSLQTLAEECDILTFHVPLYKEGRYKTCHLADDAFFQSLKRKPVIINTSRGEIIETGALLNALDTGLVSDAIIDVWENEPAINLTLLDKVFLGTPHIAGYSADGKANATRMSLDALCRYFNIQADYQIIPPAPSQPRITADTLSAAYLQMYDPRQDSNALKTHPELFEKLRGDYPLRREKEAYVIVNHPE